MKTYSVTFSAIFLALLIFLTSCSSTTLITSNPSGARVNINGENVGTTPYSNTDTKIVGSCNQLRLEKDGFKPFMTTFCRNEQVSVGAIIGGLFIWPIFLWVMEYKPGRNYELEPLDGAPSNNTLDDKKDKLLKLKELYDQDLINKEEYEKERKKILEGA